MAGNVMKNGKFSANAADRSISRPFRLKAPELACPDNSGLSVSGSSVCSAGSIILQDELSFRLLFHRVANRLYCRGADVLSMSCTCVWPADREEKEAAMLCGWMALACRQEGLEPGAVSFSASDTVRTPVVSLFAAGTRTAESSPVLPGPGKAILMAGHTGMAGAGILSCREEKRLAERFPLHFVRDAQAFAGDLSLSWVKEERAYFQPVGEGGVYAALWDLAEAAGCGFDLSLFSLPLRQETVEVTDVLGVNPYLLAGDGAVLAVTDKPQELLESMADKGREAAVIGCFTKENAKIIRRGDEVRYLDKPAQDELERYTTLKSEEDEHEREDTGSSGKKQPH